jgi:hypothetical protein
MIERGIYKHFKGGMYMVMGTAMHSETEELLVVYMPLYGNYQLMVRPLKMFSEEVLHDGCLVPRFKLEKAL